MQDDQWRNHWDQRYATGEYIFGREPNRFLVANRTLIPPGRVLCVGDGEGRNGVWLAQQGFTVTALDYSRTALDKTRRLAAEAGVMIDRQYANVLEADLGEERFSAIISIFLHLDEARLPDLHTRYTRALEPGGIFLAESYSKRQLQYSSGGPRTPEALYEAEYFRRDFPDFEFIYLNEELTNLDEGSAHRGTASVIRAILKKPLDDQSEQGDHDAR
ncbi:MAG: class I SAM-dependent methyltransferase [Candidatus Neomarinimicrobiota bacterium]